WSMARVDRIQRAPACSPDLLPDHLFIGFVAIVPRPRARRMRYRRIQLGAVARTARLQIARSAGPSVVHYLNDGASQRAAVLPPRLLPAQLGPHLPNADQSCQRPPGGTLSV